MRLFIAIKLPEELKTQILEIQKQLNIGILNKVKENAMHLTMKYIGEVPEQDLGLIKENLEKIKFKPFKFKTGSLGLLGKTFLQVIYLGVQDSKELVDLAKDVRMNVQGFGEKDTFDFLAHITVARIKHIQPREKPLIRKQVDDLSDNLKEMEVEVNSFSLFQSVLGPQGPQYTELESFSA